MMETRFEFNTIYEKFNLIRGELSPSLVLSKHEIDKLKDNNKNFILNSLSLYSSSDLKRLFMLLPHIWINIDREEIKEIFISIDNMIKPFDAFYGVFIFLYDVVRVDLYDLLFMELSFKNEDIDNFLNEKRDKILNVNQKVKSFDLKYIEIQNNILLKIKENIVDTPR